MYSINEVPFYSYVSHFVRVVVIVTFCALYVNYDLPQVNASSSDGLTRNEQYLQESRFFGGATLTYENLKKQGFALNIAPHTRAQINFPIQSNLDDSYNCRTSQSEITAFLHDGSPTVEMCNRPLVITAVQEGDPEPVIYAIAFVEFSHTGEDTYLKLTFRPALKGWNTQLASRLGDSTGYTLTIKGVRYTLDARFFLNLETTSVVFPVQLKTHNDRVSFFVTDAQ